MNSEIDWISFHGAYDFAYFLKLVTCERLPDSVAEFQAKLKVYFPHCYDVKYLLKDSNAATGSLSKVAATLGVPSLLAKSCRCPESARNIRLAAIVCLPPTCSSS